MILAFLSSAVSDDPNSQLFDFVRFFYKTFLYPLMDILRYTDILGFPLFNWLFGLAIANLAIRFFRYFMGFDNHNKD